MSGLQDARVLAAFTQGVQRPYMLGVEQRLTSLGSLEAALEDARQTGLGTFQSGSGQFTTTSTTYVDTSLAVTTTLKKQMNVLVLFSWDDFWIDGTVTEAFGYLGISVNGEAEKVVASTYRGSSVYNTYGAAASALYLSLVPGVYNFNLRAKTTDGTLKLGAASGNKIMMAAIQL